ncbi:hypothetical protein HYC85_012005 [Camellia sinensis]|uniref:Cyclin N-terminal domain-containing protein n=1 Tax=Camellia sinensis TaxID=4442 RepID=A0A7J7HAP8_CAMSI|nr:hypothetical protein HYC85_012005 [Camellia sinensis]
MYQRYTSIIRTLIQNWEFRFGFIEEAKRRPFPDYIEMAQKDVSPNMRAILVDWLVEVAEEYELYSDTLHLSIFYIDRFLSTNDLNRQKLQLLGCVGQVGCVWEPSVAAQNFGPSLDRGVGRSSES